MQGHLPHHHHHHHLQQQLAALLSAALPQSSSSSSAAAPGAVSEVAGSSPSSSQATPEGQIDRAGDDSRIGAIESLQRIILYPANGIVISHSSHFLSQGLGQLLSDKSFTVRRAAAITYGSLCSVLVSTSVGSNSVQNHGLALADRFMAWALPLLGDNGVANGSEQLALESLKEFLNAGDANSIEPFVPLILKACQELLEDERTSLSLLHKLLGLLTLISLKFGNCFQPHFADIVDLLLGWAFMPDLSKSGRMIIMNSFLQFQKHWLCNLPFSLGLLSKFLGDIEVLIQDISTEVGSQFGRLLALFSCFSTILQVISSAKTEIHTLEEVKETLESMAPRLLRCMTIFGRKFGLTKWMGESWRCLILLAEILEERFSNSYPITVDIFFQSLINIPSLQVNALIKTNLQLLSRQKLALVPSSVRTLLGFFSPFSQLRLHPNHLVVASCASTYLFFLQHGADAVVIEAITLLIEELELSKIMLGKIKGYFGDTNELLLNFLPDDQVKLELGSSKAYSETELISLIKFDLNALLSSVARCSSEILEDQVVINTHRYERSKKLASLVLEKLNPFESPFESFSELQFLIIKILKKLSEAEISSKFTILQASSEKESSNSDENFQISHQAKKDAVTEYKKKYTNCIVRALGINLPLSVKLEALDWISSFSWMVATMDKNSCILLSIYDPYANDSVDSDLLDVIFDAAYVRESKVRSLVASVLEVLLLARLIDHAYFHVVSELVLDKLGDPDVSVKNAFARILPVVLPLTIYSCGLNGRTRFYDLLMNSTIKNYNLAWKSVFALKHSSRKLHSHQFVSIMSYISQRWKVPLSSWIQRLIFSCDCKKELLSSKEERDREPLDGDTWNHSKAEESVFDKICPVNNIAAVWWAIHEAARHCVALRLRTNLGGPTQTFADLERMLLDIPNVLLLDAEQSDSKYIAQSNAHLLTMRLLLDFVEALKKNVYNAYEGSFIFPPCTRQSSIFFRANKKVCEEWFSRICEPMMNSGLALHCHDATIQYCFLRLQDLRNLSVSALLEKPRGSSLSESVHIRNRITGDVLKVVRYASLALCRNYEPEALSGLQKWVAVQFSTLFKEDKQIIQGVTGTFGYLSWITGLVYQSQGQYEKAAAFFSHMLQSEVALTLLGSDGIQFIISRVIECYTSVSDWNSLENWLTELQSLRAMHAGKAYSGALTTAGNEVNAVHALARFDLGDFQAAWSYLDLTPKSSCEIALDPKIALERSEQMLLRSMLKGDGSVHKFKEELEKAKLMLDEALSVVPLDGLPQAAACAIQLHCIHVFEEGIRSNSQDHEKKLPSVLESFHQVLSSPISRVYQDCGLWIKVFRIYRTLMPTSLTTLLLCQQLIAVGRKKNNFMLADRMIQYLKDHIWMSSKGIHTDLALTMQYEDILLNYAKDNHEMAMLDMCSLISSDALSASAISSETCRILRAKACLKLSNWLRQGSPNHDFKNVLKIHQLLLTNSECTLFMRTDLTDSGINPEWDYNKVIDELVGATRKMSCNICPTMGKAWLSYASWCFQQAEGSPLVNETVLQSCSLSPVLCPEISPYRCKMTEVEICKVEATVRRFLSDINTYSANDLDEERSNFSNLQEKEAHISSLVEQAIYIMQAAAGAPGSESYNAECPSAAVSSRLQVLFLDKNGGMRKHDALPLINELVSIWWSVRERQTSLYGHAAHCYLKYLSYSSKYLAFSPNNVLNNEKKKSCTLRAMLYVLHIVMNYGYELRETLPHDLAIVPLSPLQEVIPQLFARLSSHPKQHVRKQLEGLLMMLAKSCPWSIVYPTLVDMNANEGQPLEELQQIHDCLFKLYPKLVQDVQLVINEMGMITILWEELWLSTLQDLHTDVIRRINTLKVEAARVAENPTLSDAEKNKINAAKYSAMMAPVVVALERRLTSTSREPRTSNELWFRQEYFEQLKSATLNFKTPPKSSTALGDVWRPFDTIATSLATHHRKSCVSLIDVAPCLASLMSSDVPMPGFEKQISMFDTSGSSTIDNAGIITICSFGEQVTILSTKTKPKKLILKGSDGQMYTYLLKGREDLRLDARIMQLLQAINNCLSSCDDTRGRELTIRYYSVTPISGRAGLIQWIDNITSIYSVYKTWQINTQMTQISAADAVNVSNLPAVPRPSDMFYGKIIPALKEKGIRRVISRRDWPLEVKRKVFLELTKETPKQLLWQELWCASEGFKAFSTKAKRFSGSIAAMSIVGYILGLGDRHLDNVLMDFSSGEIVHIDYNVCFDKGRRLKVPEIVPFRLTQIIETALGLTGTEGAFRSNCEAVLKVLQKNKDIILMLLEVFIWDPLVEWTRGDIHDEAAIGGEEKKGMEMAVSLSLFASRVQEMRVPLQEHHDHMVATLPFVESALKAFLDSLNQYEVISTVFYHADKERKSLMQREASTKLVVTEATSICEKSRTTFEVQAHEFAQAKAMAAEKAQEASLWIDQHGGVLDALGSGTIPDANSLLMVRGTEESLSLVSAVVISGVPLTIVPEPTQAQCFDLDKEVSHLIDELDSGLSCAIEALNEYALALKKVLPLSYIASSPVHGWAQVLQLSVNSLSSEALLLSNNHAAELIAKSKGEGFDSVRQQHQELLHKVEIYAIEIEKNAAERSVLMESIGADTAANSKERLLSSFTKFMQAVSFQRNEDDKFKTLPGQSKCDGSKVAKSQEDLDEKKMKAFSVLCVAVIDLYKDIKTNMTYFSDRFTERRTAEIGSQADTGTAFIRFEEQIEKSVLVAGFVSEVQELIQIVLPFTDITVENTTVAFSQNWASIFQACVRSSNQLLEQITGTLLPEIIRSAVTYNSETMEAFGLLSQIRGSIDTSLEKLLEVELERASLLELEKSYFMKVGLITEQQLALGEAALSGRDNLSWEEAEEIASQEEACRSQLDQLHQSWNQKDTQSSSLKRREVNIINSLSSSQQYFTSLMNTEEEGYLHARRSKALLAALEKPFAELESVNHDLVSHGTIPINSDGSTYKLTDSVTSGSAISESVWDFTFLLRDHAFFIWKISIMDSILDMCFHEISSSLDSNVGFDQLYKSLKKKLEIHLQDRIYRYLIGRVAPAFVTELTKQTEHLQHMVEARREFVFDQAKKDSGSVRKISLMLEQYCDAHETTRAAQSAVSLMTRQENELTEALAETVLEIVQMEWLHDLSSPYLLKTKVSSEKFLGADKLYPLVLDINRPKLLEKLQSSMSLVARSVECLQACERTSASAEGQLERAMAWACAGSTAVGTGSTSKISGIPAEFHDHLIRRRQLLWAVQEQASDIIKICNSVMEFEASRDGLFWIPGEKTSGRTTADGRTWQQAYLNTLTRLDVCYHSFNCAEQEWKMAESNMEASANALFAATSELHITSVKANSASDDLHKIVAVMIEHAIGANAALSSFIHISRSHTALTSECGSMLEEVLAITEGLEDVYILGKEAATAHGALMADLSKAHSIIFPLEASLSADLAAVADTSFKDKDNNKEISLVRGQSLYQTYIFRLREAYQSLAPLVLSLTNYVKELHSTLTKLARVSNLHAGNLHQALEGLGESQISRSQNLAISGSEPSNNVILLNESGGFLESSGEIVENLVTNVGFLHDEGWISAPDHTYTSSEGSTIILSGSSTFEKSDHVEQCFGSNTTGEDTSISISDKITEGFETISVDSENQQSKYISQDVAIGLSSIAPSDLGKGKSEVVKDLMGDNEDYSKLVDERGEILVDSSCPDVANQKTRGKNAYALTVLKQVELKIDGRSIDDRSSEVSEQVDYLIKQATSIDNLCNMYEGWTPWI
ncbi:serine/threonine-protein kinase SMG1-like isoform X2 [Zingiber officinale]|uniref:serine/threonine-protein kinase SMG1-like isoform X2 n=1 Tax=Zingiber officinale TaxID=94328 RepID=UPI001C4CDD49|nr:serine/threonine-protein kinase SMG1-like isoform X2 [Zingiber officinale]